MISNPFRGHNRTESRTDETGKNIPLIPGSPRGAPLCRVGRSTWEPGQSRASTERKQETSFRGESERTKLTKDYVKDLYKKLSENISETPEGFHYDYFKLEDGELYYRGKSKPLATIGKLKSIGVLADILGKGGLRNFGFDIPRGKVTA